MLRYEEITRPADFKKFAEFNIDATDAFFTDKQALIEKTVEEFSRSRCIGIYNENGNLTGSIVLILTPPYTLEVIPKDDAQAFYEQENITSEDCIQMLFAVLLNGSANERLAFYKRNLEEMIAPGKEHILIFYTDDKHNRHQLYRRMKPEIIAQKETPEFTKRLVFVRRSHLLKELQRVKDQLNQRRNHRLSELQPF